MSEDITVKGSSEKEGREALPPKKKKKSCGKVTEGIPATKPHLST
jgi:hypothetical protein